MNRPWRRRRPAAETAPDAPQEAPAAPEYAGDYPTAPRGDGEDRDLGQWASAPVSMREKLSLELGNYRRASRQAVGRVRHRLAG
ncbi:hypothetical protein WJ972_05485 [Achromobacter insuavis]